MLSFTSFSSKVLLPGKVKKPTQAIPIKKLPNEICDLKNLIELDLGKNSELRTLPNNFNKLNKLEYLNLESVPLSFDEKKKLPKLEEGAIEY